MNLQLNRSHAHVNNIICRRINYWTTLTKPSIENRTSQRHFRYLEDAADGVRILIGAMVVENSCPVNFSFTPRSSMSQSYFPIRSNARCANHQFIIVEKKGNVTQRRRQNRNCASNMSKLRHGKTSALQNNAKIATSIMRRSQILL